jgi:ketosteroid isomerase-like protein
MRATAVALTLAAACASPPAAVPSTPAVPTVPTVPALSDPALQPLAFLAGAWRADDGTLEIWTPAGDALFGVAFAGAGFECAILAVVDGAITYKAMPGGRAAVPFVLDAATLADGDARFINPAHDDPQVIHYRRTGDVLEATVSRLDGSNAIELRFTHVEHPPAPVLAEADRQFAVDTARDGSAGWVSWFAPDGAMIGKAGRVEGHAAIGQLMSGLLDAPDTELVWAPIVSGLAAVDDVGFTVGEAHILTGGKTTWFGAYVTIWQRQADGTWRVRFDAGDDDSRRRGDA